MSAPTFTNFRPAYCGSRIGDDELPEQIARYCFWTAVVAWAALVIAVDATSVAKVFAAIFDTTVAAWVQALGGVAAIYAAFRIGNRQSQTALKLELEKRRSDRTERVAALLALFEPIQTELLAGWSKLEQLTESDGADLPWISNAHAVYFMLEIRVARRVQALQRHLHAVDVLQYGPAAQHLVELRAAVDNMADWQESFVTAFRDRGPENRDFKRLHACAMQITLTSKWSTECLIRACAAIGVELPVWAVPSLERQTWK